jgi:hypothetical protein
MITGLTLPFTFFTLRKEECILYGSNIACCLLVLAGKIAETLAGSKCVRPPYLHLTIIRQISFRICSKREVSNFVILFVVKVIKLVFETGVNFVIRV